ncbi:MAG: hypothetical protein J5614_00400 [Paludibacteraceae bacterium]|nr:hypothetical protein [Paludibacteraceae bacterium]
MNEMTIGCGCGGRVPVPRTYPFMMNGNYACDCCHQMYQPNPDNSKIPTAGMINGSLFTIVNNDPLLIQRDLFEYGTKISVSENVRTQVTRRSDMSCVNLIGTFDLTEGNIITNDSLYSFLCNKIGSQFETNEHVLSILKSGFQVKILFTVLDEQGGVVYTNSVQSSNTVGKFHYTDVMDYFVESISNVMVTNIPAMDYAGLYVLRLDRIEVYGRKIITKNHITEGLNPFYAFTENDTKISQQVDTINATQEDEVVLIATSNLNWSTTFQANITTRLKISFNVYTSNMIHAGNVYDVWSALYEPMEDVIETMRNAITSMSETITALTERINEQDATIAALARRVENIYYTSEEYVKSHYFHKGVITWLEPGTVYQTTEAYTTTDDESVTVEQAFNADIALGKLIPLTFITPVDEEVGD